MKSERKSDYLGYCKHTDLHGECFFFPDSPCWWALHLLYALQCLNCCRFPLPNELFLPWRRRNKVLISFRILKVQAESQVTITCEITVICLDSFKCHLSVLSD